MRQSDGDVRACVCARSTVTLFLFLGLVCLREKFEKGVRGFIVFVAHGGVGGVDGGGGAACLCTVSTPCSSSLSPRAHSRVKTFLPSEISLAH